MPSVLFLQYEEAKLCLSDFALLSEEAKLCLSDFALQSEEFISLRISKIICFFEASVKMFACSYPPAFLNIPKQRECRVLNVTPVFAASCLENLSCISFAAAFENVTARILRGGTLYFSIRFLMRAVITAVFPEPGPARTSIGPLL